MGRASQIFWYLNMEEHPTTLGQRTHFTHLEITPDLQKIRRQYRTHLRGSKNKVQNIGQENIFDKQGVV